MIKSLLLSSLFWAAPGHLIHRADQLIRVGLTQCGYEFVEGSDSRLPQDVLNRHIDEVGVFTDDNGALDPVLLKDWTIIDQRLSLQFSSRQGHQIVNFMRDFNLNDFSASTHQGTLMQSFTYSTPQGLLTRYYVRSHETSAAEFEDFLTQSLVPAFLHYACP